MRTEDYTNLCSSTAPTFSRFYRAGSDLTGNSAGTNWLTFTQAIGNLWGLVHQRFTALCSGTSTRYAAPDAEPGVRYDYAICPNRQLPSGLSGNRRIRRMEQSLRAVDLRMRSTIISKT